MKKTKGDAMRVYLVQHGEAVSKSEDAERPLTEQGREDVSRVAAFAQRAGMEVNQIRHSGKRRAEETAAILAHYLAPEGGVAALPGLAPRDDVRPVAELLDRETEPLMLVGHRPFLDRLSGLLVADSSETQVVQFQQGGIVCLTRDPASWAWALLWIVTPDLLPCS
jgi:phosphohistidine phosphatase